VRAQRAGRLVRSASAASWLVVQLSASAASWWVSASAASRSLVRSASGASSLVVQLSASAASRCVGGQASERSEQVGSFRLARFIRSFFFYSCTVPGTQVDVITRLPGNGGSAPATRPQEKAPYSYLQPHERVVPFVLGVQCDSTPYDFQRPSILPPTGRKIYATYPYAGPIFSILPPTTPS
jgi:hypothetical protein